MKAFCNTFKRRYFWNK